MTSFSSEKREKIYQIPYNKPKATDNIRNKANTFCVIASFIVLGALFSNSFFLGFSFVLAFYQHLAFVAVACPYFAVDLDLVVADFGFAWLHICFQWE